MSWVTEKFSLNGLTFYSCFFKKNQYCHFWVYCQGAPEIAKGYSYFFKINSKDDKQFVVRQSPTISLKYSKEDVVANDWCLTVSDHTVYDF